MNRLNGVLLGLMALLATGYGAPSDRLPLPSLEPFVIPLDQQSAATSSYSSSAAPALPRVIHQGESGPPENGPVRIPVIVTPTPQTDEQGNAVGKAGTGFFVAADGTLLTAAHVVSGCGRTQIISQYLPRAWASVVAADRDHDIAVLKAIDVRPPAMVRVAAVPPVSEKLFVLGYPTSAGLTVAAETWAETQNQKFPANIGGLANPRELLWISAPDVTHGYSGGPIFDPKLGAVVGIVKGEVEGGYLRLVRDIPPSGIAIGPGINPLGTVLRREAPYVAVALASSPVESSEETVRRATVHVLCWR